MADTEVGSSAGPAIDRRMLVGCGLGLGAALAVRPLRARPPAPDLAQDAALLGPGAEFAWMALDLNSGRQLSVNPGMRLPMCSSFKWLLVAGVLARVDAGQERLDRTLALARADLLDPSPTSERLLARAPGGGPTAITVNAACEAATVVSDNSAANLLLRELGGPAALTEWLRAHGDTVTRLDRTEPSLNFVGVGDPRDSTTPEAMIGNLRRILYGDVLSLASRNKLFRWMLDCRTAPGRLTAGLPVGWRIAHRTGTREYEPSMAAGGNGRAASGDLGALLGPRGAPVLVAAYTAGSQRPQADVDRWFATVARQVTGQFYWA